MAAALEKIHNLELVESDADEYPEDPFLNDNDFSFVYIGELGFHLQSDWLLVELTEPQRVLSSGIVLPETAVENHEEGNVLGSGPGVLCENGLVARTRMTRGEQVYFPKHAFYALDVRNAMSGRMQSLGFVRERDLVAYTHPCDPDTLLPLNDYLMLRRCPAPTREFLGVVVDDRYRERSLFIHIPERARKSPHAGYLVDFGFGSIQTSGCFSGYRRPIEFDLGMCIDDQGVSVHVPDCGDKVYFEPEVERIVIADLDGDAFVFVHARDCIAFDPGSGADSGE